MLSKARDRIDPEKLLSVSSNIFFIIYLLLGLYFYRERLFGDSGYYLFNIINDGRFFIAHQRVVDIFTQFPILFALKANLDMKILVQLFSISFVLFYYVIFFIIQYPYQKTNLAFLIVLILTLGVQHDFYIPIDELPQALAFSVLYFAALTSQNINGTLKKVGNYTVMLIAFALAVLNHPLSSIIIAYLTFFDLLIRRKHLSLHLTLIALCILNIVYKKFFGPTYESGMMSIGFNHINLLYLYQVVLLFLKKYLFHLLFLFFIGLYYFSKKLYLRLLFVYVSFVGYVGLIITTNNLSTNWFYTEHLYLPLTIIVALPLLWDVFPQASQFAKRGYVMVFLLTVTYGIFAIFYTGKTYEFRLQKMRNMVDQAPFCEQSKFVVDIRNYFEKDYMNKEIHLYWTYPSEVLIQTALDGKTKTLVFSNDLDQSIPDPKGRYHRIALAPWHSIDHRRLNKRYFPLVEGDYYPLNTPMDLHLITDQFIRNISIELPRKQKSLKRNTIYYLYVLLHNRNPIPLKSALVKGHEIYISYHWLKENEKIVWEEIRTPLEVDLHDSLSQKIGILTPGTPGGYILAVDIVAGNFRWFAINQKASFTIK